MTGSTGVKSGSTTTTFNTRYTPAGTAVPVLLVPCGTGTIGCGTGPSGQSYWNLFGTKAVPQSKPLLESLLS
jgi:hypothetical protein